MSAFKPSNPVIETITGGATLPASIANASPNAIPTTAQNAPLGNFSSGKYFFQTYNNLRHKVELYLDNSGKLKGGSNENRYFINPSSVLNMTITDTVNNWIVDGSIVIAYLPEDIDPSQFKDTGNTHQTVIKGIKENTQALRSYQFRSDGFDLLRFSVSPTTNGDQTSNSLGSLGIDENDPNWYLSYLLSVYDVQDVTGSIPDLDGFLSTYTKCLKLSFRDIRYQIMKTTNLEYSTALSPNATTNPNLANAEGVLNTGQAIIEVFNKALADPQLDTGCPEFKLQFSDASEWDIGESQIFYTSPAGWSAADDVDYLLSHHVSSKKLIDGINDLCLLHTDRAKNPNDLEPIKLNALSDFFEKAGKDANNPGELQLEHFFTTAQTDSTKPISKGQYRAPLSKNVKDKKDLKTAKYGQILSYSFVDMSADINSSLFRTTPVYSVDVGKRVFNIEFKNNDIMTARKVISKSYIDKLYKGGNANLEDLFLPTIHKTKKNVNVFPTFSLNGDNKIVRQKNGILDLIYTGVFHNACICFKTPGLTLRQSGTFIGIDKTDGCEDNDYNNKLYGQWFVVRVDHIFEAGTFMNVIYAIKIHRFSELKAKFDGVLV